LQLIADALTSPVTSKRKTAQKEALKLSVDDQKVLLGHLGELALQDPSRHPATAESLAVMVGTDEERAQIAVRDLGKLPGRDVSMSLAVQLLSGRPIAPSIRGQLEVWKDQSDVPELVRTAIAEGLERN
jgi:hypothetical protein